MANDIFNYVKSNKPSRSLFDLSYEKKFTCDAGQLIPVMCDEVVPGDTFTIGNQIVIRMQPLVAPVLHEINVYVHYFFVPYRLLWDDWEEFITGGVNGDFAVPLPRWDVTKNEIGSLWDFLGFPVGVKPAGKLPLDFPKRAYNFIWNEYYRDENLQEEVDIEKQEDILIRNWEKDYFTSALPFQQRGVSPAFSTSGTVDLHFPDFIPIKPLLDSSYFNLITANFPKLSTLIDSNSLALFRDRFMAFANNGLRNSVDNYIWNMFNYYVETPSDDYLKDVEVNPIGVKGSDLNTVTVSGATAGFSVSDLRLAFQIQKWLERNARAGARYTEFLKAHFGVSPHDERLQRPEYIGGSKSAVIISEVPQTSETSDKSAQGTLSGKGITADSTHAGKYFATEYGLIMGIMSIMPRSSYQQGINRQWLRETRFDFFSPEFANLSEQGVEQVELFASDDVGENTKLFGYQGRYNEMRCKQSMVCSGMRDTFDYWHISRKFGNAPKLNSEFIQCNPRKDIFAVQDEPGFIVDCGNVIRAVRPLPIQAEPGLIDHV